MCKDGILKIESQPWGKFKCCTSMQQLIDKGLVSIEIEDIDNKGNRYTASLILPDGTSTWFRFCPYCGVMIFNLLVNDEKCENPDITRKNKFCDEEMWKACEESAFGAQWEQNP